MQKLLKKKYQKLSKKILYNYHHSIPHGENYEKVKNAKIVPFEITDLKKIEKNEKKKSRFFNVEIEMPGVKERVLKIYLEDEIKVIVDNFCKIYCIKEEIKDLLIQTIINAKNQYLEKREL